MKVLVACEESQRVCTAFREKGHEAYSCDLIECSGGHPEWHIKADVLPLINGRCSFKTCDRKEHIIEGKWDLLIAHPPCTFMTKAGACRMYKIIDGERYINEERFFKAMAAKEFFLKFYNADCDRICIENPTPMKIIGLPPPSQVIQPYEYGEPYSKRTLLWLTGLPALCPTNIITEYKPFLPSNTSKNKGTDYNKGCASGSKEWSKTFLGIANAMAEQWG